MNREEKKGIGTGRLVVAHHHHPLLLTPPPPSPSTRPHPHPLYSATATAEDVTAAECEAGPSVRSIVTRSAEEGGASKESSRRRRRRSGSFRTRAEANCIPVVARKEQVQGSSVDRTAEGRRRREKEDLDGASSPSHNDCPYAYSSPFGIAPFLLPFLSFARAAPPPSPPHHRSPPPPPRRLASPSSSPSHPSPSPTTPLSSSSTTAPSVPTPSRSPLDPSVPGKQRIVAQHPDPDPDGLRPRGIAYLTSVAVPTDMPNEVNLVDETVLPYILTKAGDGTWQKASGGWRLYGRQAGSTAGTEPDTDGDGMVTTTQIAAGAQTFAVESALPKGWGQTSSRTSFYKVPLIVVASVLLAIGIVIGIILMVFSRRKAHRKAKRRAERLRRKALAAAGLNEADIDGDAAQAAFKEKLQELESKYGGKNKRGKASVGKIKVGKWRSGLRRRRGAGKERDEDAIVEVIQEDEGEGEGRPPAPIVGVTSPGDDGDSGRVSSESRGSATGSSGQDGGRPDSGGRGSSDDSPRMSGTETQSTSADPHAVSSSSSSSSQQHNGPPAPYFPPAYRPASVRSYRLGASSSSPPQSHDTVASSSPLHGHDDDDDVPLPHTEKVNAPGYYPAPATEDAEHALAVASRSDGKARAPHDFVEDNDEASTSDAPPHIGHVATDDKRVLERMRLGASAPPATAVEEPSGDDDGPSAPRVEVDEHGFERLDAAMDDSAPPPSARPSLGFGELPAPPPGPLSRIRSLGLVEQETREQLDELCLLPSQPPVTVLDAEGADDAGPSAPPLLEEMEGDEVPQTPSAPPLEREMEDGAAGAALGQSDGSSQQEGEELPLPPSLHPHVPSPSLDPPQSQPNQQHAVPFLPRYEP